MLELARSHLAYDLQLFENDLEEFSSSLQTSEKRCGLGVLEKDRLSESLFAPAREALSARGKRIRPLLAYWIFRNFLGDTETVSQGSCKHSSRLIKNAFAQVRHIALATEILHCASLVIDDVEDGSEERRGRPALHRIHGVPLSINAGTWLYFAAVKLLKRRKVREAALQTLDDCHLGQALDLGNSSLLSTELVLFALPDERWKLYRNSARLKTARLMEFAVTAAAHVCGVRARDTRQIARAIELFGVAFQALDDLKNFSPELSHHKTHEDLNSGLRNAVCVELIGMLPAEDLMQARQALHAGEFKSFVLSRRELKSAEYEVLRKVETWLTEARELMSGLNRDAVCHTYIHLLIEKPLQELLSTVQFAPGNQQSSSRG